MTKKKFRQNELLPETVKPSYREIGESYELPIFILPKVVLFPESTIPLTNLEGLNPAELEEAKKGILRVGVVTQVSDNDEKNARIAAYGTEAIVNGVIKLSDHKIGAVVKGVRRFAIEDIKKRGLLHTGQIKIIADCHEDISETKLLAATKSLKNLILEVLRGSKFVANESVSLLYATDDPRLLCDLITGHLSLTAEEKLAIFSTFSLIDRIELVLKALAREIDLLKMSHKIQEEVRDELQEGVKRNFLREQIAAIKRELGESESEFSEIRELEEELAAKELPEQVARTAVKELGRLQMMHPSSPEYMISWTYLNWINDLPWKEPTQGLNAELSEANRILDKDHFGLSKVKERISEYLAAMIYRGHNKGDLLLLVGPPGVGKTSLARSVAKTLDRPFTRISLGGVRDESEIRGHRRAYIGAMPGKIINAVKELGTTECVICLDEIDKVGQSQLHGDLSSALLEVLDPEQNSQFTDHYLNLPFDLSKVVFVATANEMRLIPTPLLDRMECIQISGYTEHEKVKIAQKYLLPKVRKEIGLKSTQFKMSEKTLRAIIQYYTRESGVRELQRKLTSLGRKSARSLLETEESLKINELTLIKHLGAPKFFHEPKHSRLEKGVAIGLAYTSVGGDILYIEARKSPGSQGRGRFVLTGSLGQVMQESAQTALSYLISNADTLSLDREQLESSQIHLHFPDGATPKDGPSAGVAIMCCLVSLFSNKALKANFAMTGEITLRGQVLPVGGIKEKLLAAHRYGKKQIIMPQANWLDLEDIPTEVMKGLSIYPVSSMLDVLKITKLIKGGTDIEPTEYQPLREIPHIPIDKIQPQELLIQPNS